MPLVTAEKTTPVLIESEEDDLMEIIIQEARSFVEWRFRKDCGEMCTQRVEISAGVHAALLADVGFQGGLQTLVDDTHPRISTEVVPEEDPEE